MHGSERPHPFQGHSPRWTPIQPDGRPPGPARRKRGFARQVPPPFSLNALPLMAFAIGLTGAALFLPAVPLWCAGLPLLMAIMAQSFTNRFVLCFAFFFWPALTATLGLTTLGHPAPLVSAGTALAVLILPLLMAWLGVVPVGIALLALPTFPASPLPVLADALPGPVPVSGLGLLLVMLMIIEHIPLPFTRGFFTLLFCAGLGLSHFFAWIYADRVEADLPQTAWAEHPVPVSITERAGWIRLRDSLPQGSEAILGENLFAEGDIEALDFWRQAARDRTLTLRVGIHANNGRGMLLRLSPETAAIRPAPVAAARYGIPGITGTWGRMPSLEPGPDPDDDAGVDWLFCYEALLPWAWVPILVSGGHFDKSTARPVVVLANDRLTGPLPFHVTRRKVARAMAGLAGRRVYFAETGRTILLRNTEGGRHELE